MVEKQSKFSEINRLNPSGAMAFMRRLALLAALGTIGGISTKVRADQSPKIARATEQNEVFKIMSELIKSLGKNYQYAGKQSDGSVIQCAQGKTKVEAEREVEKRIKAIAGNISEFKFVGTQLADGSWVVAGMNKKEQEQTSVFDVMGDLINEFGAQYKYAGKQGDGSVIQCAQGKTKGEAENEAKKRTLNIIPTATDIAIQSKQMSNGTWVVATRGVINFKAPQKERSTASSDDFKSVILESHNRLRQEHCAPPLKWSEEAEAVAQKWASQLKRENCAFYHNPNKEGYGENLAWGTTGHYSTSNFVQMWYDEIKDYDFSNPGFSMKTGHFTQVVWRSTSGVGCAPITCNNGTLLVCNYSPPGNWEGSYPKEVLPKVCKK